MECELCGAEISEGAFACPRCGHPVSRLSSPEGGDARKKPSGSSERPPVDRVAEGPTAQRQPPRTEKPVAPAGPRPPQGNAGGSPPVSEPRPRTPEGAPAGPPGSAGGEPSEPPLARLEEDFIAMAEEQVGEVSPEPPEGKQGEVPPESKEAPEQPLPPGAYEPTELDDKLTGGYKGPEVASVAGGGEQTADDPFGLNITETAPPQVHFEPLPRRKLTAVGIIKLVLSLFAVAAAIAVGLYFGFFREAGPSPREPVKAVHDMINQVVSEDLDRIEDVAVEGASIIGETSDLLKPYRVEGLITLNSFDAETTRMTDTSATVEMEEFVVQIATPQGTTRLIDVLELNEPEKLPTTVKLVYEDGNWLVTD